ncbi:DUF3261 domain-containing protein [Ferrovibrio sp.]|uniref:DUF3261 domain-containing protein n=1 Tax=Ferrovibrio sp. TaxID=1917215 RepID=UPI001B42E235|nr:DUF3261 domain-containing protein [Ferrovibrio sp.]MBP7063119.1 DUF3261 domain-containing protein [Ferrovibrio sp.]
MMRRRDLPWLLSLPFVAGCAVSRSELPPTAPLLAPGLLLALPQPGEIGRDLRAYQLVTLRYGDTSFVFESHIQIVDNRFILLIVDTLGRRALQLDWTGMDVIAQPAAWLPDILRPGSMLADIVALHWPEASLRRALAASGAALIDLPGQRQVILAGRVIAEARYDFAPAQRWTGTAQYANQAWGYSLRIESKEIGV